MIRESASFDDMCPYWEFFEREGLNENILAAKEHIASPILLLGSGQGAVSQILLDAGFDVTSVDISKSMTDYAKARRGIDTVHADATSVSLGRRFQSIVVSTGVVTESNVGTRFLPLLLENIGRHLAPQGRILVTYLGYSLPIKAFAALGLLGRPSNNRMIWDGRQSLEAVKHRFVEDGYNKPTLDLLFGICQEALDAHRLLIAAAGEKYTRAHQAEAPPPDFFEQCADFSHCVLGTDTERILLEALAARYAQIGAYHADNGTIMVVCTAK